MFNWGEGQRQGSSHSHRDGVNPHSRGAGGRSPLRWSQAAEGEQGGAVAVAKTAGRDFASVPIPHLHTLTLI